MVRDEDETLVAMGNILKTDQIVEDKQEKCWYVNLTFNEEVNERLSAMISYLKEEILQDQAAVAYHSIGQMHEIEEAFSSALQSYHTVLSIWKILLKTKLNVDRQVIAQLLSNIAEVYDKTKHYAFALWYYAQAIKFAEGDTALIQEYKESFQAVAGRVIDIFRKFEM